MTLSSKSQCHICHRIAIAFNVRLIIMLSTNQFSNISCLINMLTYKYRAGGNGPAAPVLAKPVFLKVKIKIHFHKKQVIKKSASVIFELVRLIILSYNR